MPINGKIVTLGNVKPNMVADKAYRRALRGGKDKEEFDRKYPPYEWARKAYIMRMLIAGSKSVLDVGVGPGYFINMLSWSKKFERVSGVDSIPRNPGRFTQGVTFAEMSAKDLSFADNEFDCVTSLGFIERLPEQDVEPVLKELRRVAKRQLIVSVPFDEPLPLRYSQQFGEDRIKALFPTAKFSLLMKPGRGRVPWIVMDERF